MDIQRQKNSLHTTEISSSNYVWENHILKYTFLPESFNINVCNIHLNISGLIIHCIYLSQNIYIPKDIFLL